LKVQLELVSLNVEIKLDSAHSLMNLQLNRMCLHQLDSLLSSLNLLKTICM